MIKRIYILLLTTISLSLLLAACAADGPKAPDEEHVEPIPIKMVLLPFLGLAPHFIAAEEGYFVEEGLQVEFIDMNSGVETIPGLLQGDLDVAQSGLNFSILNAINRGGPLKIVGGTVYFAEDHCPATALMSSSALAKSGELDSADGWQDKRIATNPTGVEGYFVDVLLNQFDLSIDDVEIEDLPPPVLPEALQSGAIDLAQSSEPWLTRIKENTDAEIWVGANDVIPDFQFAVILFGPNILEENPEAGERFMRAYQKAVRQYNEGKTDRNVEILAKYTELEPELLREICWPSIRSDGQLNVESVLQFQEWGIQRGLLDEMVSEEDFWDGSFVD